MHVRCRQISSIARPVPAPPANPDRRAARLHRKMKRNEPQRKCAAMPEIYVSTDVETDGPIPGPHSMLSFASAAYRADKTLLGTFSANLHTLPGASGHPETMAWWQTQPEAWAAARSDPRDPEEAMRAYVAWLKALPGTPVFVAYPA